MGNVSYTAHISNKKSAITSKAKMEKVAKHNLRKYVSKDKAESDIIILKGSSNLIRDVKEVYHQEFDEALKEYNAKQLKPERRIEDYYEHVAQTDQDMAVEIIIQCGDKEFWESHSPEYMKFVYGEIIVELEELLPDFKIANAVVHLDEASPHLHIVGVPVGHGFQRGLSTKVSKRSVFTQESLSDILQGKLREATDDAMRFYYKQQLKEKSKGRNHDLSVMEFKVQQETKHYETAKEQVEQASEELEELVADKENLQQENAKLELMNTMMAQEVEEHAEELEELQSGKEMIEFKRTMIDHAMSQIRDTLKVIRAYLNRYMPIIPHMEQYARAVEHRENLVILEKGKYTALGDTLQRFAERVPQSIIPLYCLPRFVRWKTSKGEVVPVFTYTGNQEDSRFILREYQDLETGKHYSADSLQDEIREESRIGTVSHALDMLEIAEMEMDSVYHEYEEQIRKGPKR